MEEWDILIKGTEYFQSRTRDPMRRSVGLSITLFDSEGIWRCCPCPAVLVVLVVLVFIENEVEYMALIAIIRLLIKIKAVPLKEDFILVSNRRDGLTAQ